MSAAARRARQLFLQHPARLTDQIGMVQQLDKFAQLTEKNPLPQFLLLGSSNVGKSSLLAQLLAPNLTTAIKTTNITKKSNSKVDIPFVSKRAGFTQTLNVYTLKNNLRIIDSPGYGWKSTVKHGEIVTQFLDRCAGLCRMAYVLLLSTRGITDADRAVCAMLTQQGVPFSFVVTKCDLVGGARLRNTSPSEVLAPGGANAELREQLSLFEDETNTLCKELGAPLPPPLLPISIKDRFGVDELRANMLLLSGLIEAK